MNKYNLGYISDEDIIGTFYDVAFGGEGRLRKVSGVLQDVLNG